MGTIIGLFLLIILLCLTGGANFILNFHKSNNIVPACTLLQITPGSLSF